MCLTPSTHPLSVTDCPQMSLYDMLVVRTDMLVTMTAMVVRELQKQLKTMETGNTIVCDILLFLLSLFTLIFSSIVLSSHVTFFFALRYLPYRVQFSGGLVSPVSEDVVHRRH